MTRRQVRRMIRRERSSRPDRRSARLPLGSSSPGW
jgi:hypothetical protein